jgi:hypothetical protein
VISILIKLPKMSGTSLLTASVQKVQAAKKGVSLPTSLEGAAISDVIVQDVVDKVAQEALLDDNGKRFRPHFLSSAFLSVPIRLTRFTCFALNGA